MLLQCTMYFYIMYQLYLLQFLYLSKILKQIICFFFLKIKQIFYINLQLNYHLLNYNSSKYF